MAGAAARALASTIERIARALAIAGGLLVLAVALLVTASVVLRQTPLRSIPGDFELAQMGVALAAFAFLPWCQMRRGHIAVDSFTTRLPHRIQAALDALWDVVSAGAMALIAWRLAEGAFEAIRAHTTTMVLLLPLGPAIALCAALSAFLAGSSVLTAFLRLRSAT